MYAPSFSPQLEASLKKNPPEPHSKSVLSALKPPQRLSSSSTSSEDTHPVIGDILKDGNYSWLARGSIFIILSPRTNSVNSIFDFNHVFPSFRYAVTSCCPCDNLLLVGLKGTDGRGCLAVFNPLISKLVKAIEVPYPVTALELVSSHGGAVEASRSLAKNLRYLFGVVAVGTEEGHLYLIDLRFDSSTSILGNAPAQIEIVPTVLRDVPATREAVVGVEAHLAFELQSSCHEEAVFHFAYPDDEIIESFYPSDAGVTTLLYEPRATSLFVGFVFGQFQIFSLQDMCLIYSSDLLESSAPVLKFAFQEPENDPRNFCYLWVAKGASLASESSQRSSSEPLTLFMFQLMFMKKEILPKSRKNSTNKKFLQSQVLYKDFEACSLQFEHSLGNDLVGNIAQSYGSTLLMCSAIENYLCEFEPTENRENDMIADDYCFSPASSLCIFGWLSTMVGKHSGRKLSLIVFDINRWYMARMPNRFRGSDADYIFSAFWTINTEKDGLKKDELILSMQAPPAKIQHFTSGMRPFPERYLLPSACSFSCYLLTDLSSYNYSMLGFQQQVLNTAAEMKSMCLVNPKEMHSSILASELFSKHDIHQACTPDMMRDNILTMALDHGQISFLLSVVRDLASGHLAACGCTLRSMMDWAWKSVANVKDSIDKLCVPIFDCTSSTLDTLVQSQMNFRSTQIHHLKIIFQKLTEYTEDASEQSKEEVKTKLNVVSLIHQYLQVVQWFISNGLLPEQLDNVDRDQEVLSINGVLVYKYHRLRQVFDQRRDELSRIGASELLLIDGWIEEIGEPITSRWLKEEGGKKTYPPPSFMTLLDMYYLDCVDVISKHCLVMYLLLDVLAMFSTLENDGLPPGVHESQKERLNSIGSFLHLFSVPAGLIKLTQGFWLLDHKNFEDALNVFLDADTSPPPASWQERRILRSFLHQGHPTMALKYLSTRHPKVETVEDAKMHITIYIKSRDPSKAWKLVQLSTGHDNMNELFLHLFTMCQEHSQIHQLLKLPFSPMEERMIIKYLKESKSIEATQMLILFHLQHSRYVEAIKLHTQNKHNRLMRDQGEESRRCTARLDHIVHSYVNLLPKIEREVTFSNKKLVKHSAKVRHMVHKPSHVAAAVHAKKATEPLSRAARLTTLMDNMDEAQRNTKPTKMTPFRKKPTSRSSEVTSESESIFVLPNAVVPDKKRYSMDIHGLLGRRSSFGSPARGASKPSLSNNTISRTNAPHLKDRRSAAISVASMLLQTPPIHRRRQSAGPNKHNTPFDIQTPHSILKVKQLLDKNRSPSLSVISRASSIPNSPVKKTGPGDSDFSAKSESILDDAGNYISENKPTVSTPAKGQCQAAKKHDESVKNISENISEESNDHSELFEVPKKLRFVGLDGSTASSNDMEDIPSSVQVVTSNLTPVVIEAEDSENNEEMDIDVIGDDSTDPVVQENEGMVELSAISAEAESHQNLPENLSGVGGASPSQIDSDKSSDDAQVEDNENTDNQTEVHDADEDEVICLDSSSDEDPFVEETNVDKPSVDVVEEETVEWNKPADDSLRLVLTSTEESLEPGQDEVSDDDLVVKIDYTSGHSLEKEESRVVAGSMRDRDTDINNTKRGTDEKEGYQGEQENRSQEVEILKGSSEEEESPDRQAEKRIQDKDDVPDQKNVSEVTRKSSDSQEVHAMPGDSPGSISPELFVPHLSSSEYEIKALIGEDASMGQDAVEIPDAPNLAVAEGISVENSEESGARLAATAKESEGIQKHHDAGNDSEQLQLHLSGEEEELFGGQLAFEGQSEFEWRDTVLPVVDEVKSGEHAADLSQEVFLSETENVKKNPIELGKNEDVLPLEGRMDLCTDVEAESSVKTNLPSLPEQIPSESAKSKIFEVGEELMAADKQDKTDIQVELHIISTEIRPSTPVVNRVRSEPSYVLSPPTTRRSTRKSSRTVRVSPKQKVESTNEVPKSPSRVTRQASRQMKDAKEPEFLFSPPTTRKRVSRRKDDANQSVSAVSPPRSSTKRARGKLKLPEVDSDHSSAAVPTMPESKLKSRSARKRESSEEKNAGGTDSTKTGEMEPERLTSSTPSKRARKKACSPEPPTTPSRRTQKSPARKTQATPTRSSSRVKARLQMIDANEKGSESESQADEPPSRKRSTRRRHTTASDVTSSGTDSEVSITPSRRSSRLKSSKAKGWSPSQDKTRLIDLTPLVEEEEEDDGVNKKKKKGKSTSSTRVTRSSTTNPVKMRRKAKIFTFDE